MYIKYVGIFVYVDNYFCVCLPCMHVIKFVYVLFMDAKYNTILYNFVYIFVLCVYILYSPTPSPTGLIIAVH